MGLPSLVLAWGALALLAHVASGVALEPLQPERAATPLPSYSLPEENSMLMGDVISLLELEEGHLPTDEHGEDDSHGDKPHPEDSGGTSDVDDVDGSGPEEGTSSTEHEHYTKKDEKQPLTKHQAKREAACTRELRGVVNGQVTGKDYKFLPGKFAYDEARFQCKREWDPLSELCTFTHLNVLHDRGYEFTDWGWIGGALSDDTDEGHTAKLDRTGATNGGLHSITHKSNAHCCKNFPAFKLMGSKEKLTLNPARSLCSIEFGGHLCSLDETKQAFRGGARSDQKTWAWTNSPSTWGNPGLNYHVANIWDVDVDKNSPARKPTDEEKSMTWGDLPWYLRKKSLMQGQLGRVSVGSQDSDVWTGAALCCKGYSLMNRQINRMRDWLVARQVKQGHLRAGLFHSFEITDPVALKKLPWPDVPFRSRTYDNAVASIGLLLNGDERDMDVVFHNLNALKDLLEPSSTPPGSATISFAFNLEGSEQETWKSNVYRVGSAAWVGQAFATYHKVTTNDVFDDDIRGLAKWIMGRKRPDGLLSGGFKGDEEIETVKTEENFDAYFFLLACSEIFGDDEEDYAGMAANLRAAIMKHLWDPRAKAFNIQLDVQGPGTIKIKALKMMSRAVIFLMEGGEISLARHNLDHPFWIPHTFNRLDTRTNTDKGGWGKVVWGEGALGMIFAFRRHGDERAVTMLQDLDPLVSPSGGVLTLSDEDVNPFPFPSAAATGWYLLAQSRWSYTFWRNPAAPGLALK